MNLESDDKLRNIQVIGEISNLKIHHSGHWYLTLKDERSRISAVMFATQAKKVKIPIKDGMKVILQCDIGVYEQGGNYQLYVQSIDPIGLGSLYLEFEELKKKLHKEKLFADDHKISIPKYPYRIGVISAPQGAAIKDVLTTLNRRWPIAEVELIPTLVQGNDAAADIVKSLQIADGNAYDVIIVTRGGGSLEDLWPFNEEIVAYQIYKTKTPIIAAIGHETDFTIADYVADLRAPTPTAAAELATPSIQTVKSELFTLETRMINATDVMLRNKKQSITSLKRINIFAKPEYLYATRIMLVDSYRSKIVIAKEKYFSQFDKKFVDYKNKITNQMNRIFESQKNTFVTAITKLDAYSPLKVLERGYAIVATDQKVIKSISEIQIGEKVNIRLSDGKLEATINKKEN